MRPLKREREVHCGGEFTQFFDYAVHFYFARLFRGKSSRTCLRRGNFHFVYLYAHTFRDFLSLPHRIERAIFGLI